MEKVALHRMFAALTPERRTEVAATVNQSRVRLVKLSGAGNLDSHPHDEFALVLSGQLTVQFADREVVLGPAEGVVIPRGTEHNAIGRDAEFVLFEPDPDAA